MKQHLTEQEQRQLDQRVAEAEKRTGCQIVLAVVARSDDYPELPWKAFALAAAVAGSAAALLDRLRADWHTAGTVLFVVAATLVAGAGCALLTVAWPGFARLFLDRGRAEAESRQYAESLFLKRELFGTKGRTGILLFVSLFEREVIVLPDTGLAGRLGTGAFPAIIERMTTALAGGQISHALDQGLLGLEEALSSTAPGSLSVNELPDRIIQEG
ncbi:MAG: TPM domain-containing protein, partial [Nitrospirota bacterium]